MGDGSLGIRMLGGFSISLGDKEINDGDNRSKKVWLLLAYMICSRSHPVTQQELVELLWGDEESSSNPVNALKTMFHRVRTMLDGLGDGMGHRLIVRADGSYAWNPDVDFTLDIDEFEAMCSAGENTADDRAKAGKYLDAISLYSGDFLPRLSSEPWVVPKSAWLHELYVRTANAAAELLEDACRMDDVAALCSRAIELEPYNEELYLHLMRSLLALGRSREAVTAYRNMSELMYDNFGVTPSDDIKALYREALNTVNDREVSLGTVREQLREPDTITGALICDYDLFKIIYHAQARSVARSGDAVHIGLISVSGADGRELSKQSLDVCMDNLQKLICASLRKGDVASRCSVTQYVILLPQANYENSCMVCERVTKAFARQYPHSPARLHFSVQPLEPVI
jgi:DNA-binding SARP family transcriptional activator